MQKLLSEKRAVILDKWFDRIANSYQPETAGFFKRQKDQFANPVGHTFATQTEALLQCFIDDAEPEEVCGHLEQIIKITSIQEMAPSKAVFFLYALKDILREEIRNDPEEQQLIVKLMEFEKRIDQAALFAFDIFTSCREKHYQLRVDEVKRRVSTVLKRSDMFFDESEVDSDSENGGTECRELQRGGER